MELLEEGFPSRRIYTVSALTDEIKDLIEGKFGIIWVEGEISNFRIPTSGHYYMVLKDESAQIRAVMFRPQTRLIKFVPEDGMKVIVQGRITVYKPRGEYQIILEYIEPLGVGALALAFEQLKRRLAEEGLFDHDKKRPLPVLPRKVAVITSPTGAAIRDFLNVIHRRFANIEIIIIPVKVQGDEATDEIIQGIEVVNKYLDVDVIVLTRGGGSLEDLWAFNREELARAIRASEIPIVSAVGHEIDVTISDLAADFRAPTPSAAAELLVMEKETIINKIMDLNTRLSSNILNRISSMKDRLEIISRGLKDPKRRIADLWLKLDDLRSRMCRTVITMIQNHKRILASEKRTILGKSPDGLIGTLKQKIDFYVRSIVLAIERTLKYHSMSLEMIRGKMEELNPLGVLKRGYSITYRVPDNRILRTARDTEKGQKVSVLLYEGKLSCIVEEISVKRERDE
jgi:exodeoxyribonuclease VII large subunit